MNFHLPTAEIYIPDGVSKEQALQRTTHLAVAAHPDDLEIMAAAPILDCFQRDDRWFTGVVVTDGRGSPRTGHYEHFGDEAMRQVRFKEQRKAAVAGEYGALILLDYPSQMVKEAANRQPVADLRALLQAAGPQFVYTHNLADKHDTHVAVALRTLAALRGLAAEARPQALYGCEVWRGLDWLVEVDRVVLEVSDNEPLQQALLGVFASQIAGGKRYDLAAMGRRRANATFSDPHEVDQAAGVIFGMDLTPLISDPDQEIGPFVQAFVRRLGEDIGERLRRMG